MHYFKTLKHKTLIDTFGILGDFETAFEIYHSDVPRLHPMTANMEDILKYEDSVYPDQFDHIRSKLADYDLVEVELFFK